MQQRPKRLTILIVLNMSMQSKAKYPAEILSKKISTSTSLFIRKVPHKSSENQSCKLNCLWTWIIFLPFFSISRSFICTIQYYIHTIEIEKTTLKSIYFPKKKKEFALHTACEWIFFIPYPVWKTSSLIPISKSIWNFPAVREQTNKRQHGMWRNFYPFFWKRKKLK